MAKQGEGDPRWVVRERQDGRNVNGWHWEDKDVTEWAQSRLKTLISCTTCHSATPSPGVAVTSLDTVDGDATLYNRKGVLKVLFDLKLSGKWSSLHPRSKSEGDDGKEGEGDDDANSESDAGRTTGGFKVELFDEDPDVTVTMDAKSGADAMFKAGFVKYVSPIIVRQCTAFIKEMHEGGGQSVEGLVLPKGKTSSSAARATVTSRTEISGRSSSDGDGRKGGGGGGGGDAKGDVVMVERFTCKTRDWYFGLTDVARLSAITRSRAVSEPAAGGRWEVMGGAASGKYVSVVEGESISMLWRLKSWGEDVEEGLLTVKLKEEDGRTEATVSITGVPKNKTSETEGFWRVQILQAMRVVMGWGSASQFL